MEQGVPKFIATPVRQATARRFVPACHNLWLHPLPQNPATPRLHHSAIVFIVYELAEMLPPPLDSGMDWKYSFLTGLALLLAASALTEVNLPSHRSRYPVLHWTTDDNPERISQVAHFERWLRRHHYPKVTLRLDFANNDMSKDIIQGVSGDADDLMDMYGFGEMNFLAQCGLLYNVAPAARKMGFDASKTWPALRPDLLTNGKQYVFPDNVDTALYWVNQATFRRYHQPIPPRTWTFAQFQRRGLAFVRAANPPGATEPVFFANSVNTGVMRRSLGLSAFNETLTRCILNDPRYIRVLRLMYRWTFVDHLLPTPAQQASFATQEGYGGAGFQLFNSGQYAMFYVGRYMLIQLRKFYRTTGPIPLAVSDPPYGEFPNSSLDMRGAAIYTGSPHKQLAEYFLAYLASRTYNMQIVRDGDAEPPNPIYTRTREFLNPPQYPNEAGCSGAFAQACATIAIPFAYSPFVQAATVQRIVNGQAETGFIAGIYTARQAAQLAAERINQHMADNVRASPRLRRLYAKLRRRQNRIDRLRRAGQKVPLRLIANPFYRRYYAWKGWAN